MFDKRTGRMDFSPQGYRWMASVGLCLQKALHQERCRRINANVKGLSCENVEEFAMSTHPECYLNPNPMDPNLGVCSLSIKDLAMVMKVIHTSLGRRAVWKQLKGVLKSCHFFTQAMIDSI